MEKIVKKAGELSFRLQSTYYHFFKDSPSAMAIADRWGIIVESNDRFNELITSLSGTPLDVTNNSSRLDSTFDFLPIHDAIRFSNLLSKLADDNASSMEFKTPYRDKNGRVHWFKIHAWKMDMDPRIDLSGRGNFIGFSMNDETVETEAEERMHDEMRIAEKAMETKSRFLATMSHEIRTPIQTIIGVTELLEDTSLNTEQGEYAQQIKFSADVLLSLVNDILDYSKIEAGKMEVEKIPFVPAEIINQSAKMLSQEIEKKGLKLILKLEPDVQRSIIGDPGKFRQILINLIKNAIKFTAEGTITIGGTVALGEAQIRTITISVADTGIGIPKEARERLFTTFMQADTSHSRRFGGTGLGLAISHNMVELMGGTIEMIPNKEGGSIFRFTIPAEEAEPNEALEDRNEITGPAFPASTPAPAPADTQKHSAAAESLFPAARQKSGAAAESSSAAKVMIVEDHPVNRQLFVLIMKKLGIEPVEAEDGLEALEKADPGLDLVFMDIQMPRMDGYEAVRELRKRGFTKPIIAVTAGVQQDEQKQCREAGFDDVLFKPFKRPDIEGMFRKWTTQPQSDAGAVSAGAENHPEASPPAQDPVKSDKNTVQIFSREDILDTFMQNIDSAKTLLTRFLERSAEQINALPGLVKEENWEEAYRFAHSIKGSSRNLSGMELGDIAAALESAYKEKDMQKIEASLPILHEKFERFKSAAEDFIKS